MMKHFSDACMKKTQWIKTGKNKKQESLKL